MLEAIVRHGRRGQIDDFLAQGDRCGWCRHPIRLRGFVVSGPSGVETVTFSSASLPDGVVLKACGSRSEVRCPSCAAVYRGDSRHLVRTGLVGVKGVDEAIALHPAVFLTLTAPSFGAAHLASAVSPCHAGDARAVCAHGLPLECRGSHERREDLVGTPLCPDCYDYEGAVLQNASTPELWRRTMIYTQRQLAFVLGLTQADAGGVVRLSFCRVAEFQRRGVVHLHAIVRADGPNGSLPPVDAEQLARSCLQAAAAVTMTHPKGTAAWGRQIDVQVLEHGDERARRVAIYVAKYATKSSSDDPRLDAPLRSLEDLDRRGLAPHPHRMAATALELGADPALSNFKLVQHAHRLGFGGHYLSKSRHYSTTFSALRDARVQWREAHRLGGDVPTDHSFAGRWHGVGAGWANKGEALFAACQQRQRAEEKKEAEFWWYTRSE
jgi:replication initiator protein RepSA